MAQVPAASRPGPGRVTREASTTGYASRGSTATQPTGAFPSYARSPGTWPASTYARCRARFPSPFPARQSALAYRKKVHQQPSQAPFAPNRRSRSGQRSEVSGRKVKAGMATSYRPDGPGGVKSFPLTLPPRNSLQPRGPACSPVPSTTTLRASAR